MTNPGDVYIESGAPDWDQLAREVHCPLCEYNLRGLIEPRCPECGHGFVWRELMDVAAVSHPWLFEHCKVRPFQSLIITFFRSHLPGTFWRSVRPSHRPNVRRLVIYALAVASLAIGMIFVNRCVTAVKYYQFVMESRQYYRKRLEREVTLRQMTRESFERRYGSIEATAANRVPVMPFHRTLMLCLTSSDQVAILFLLGAIIWPWLTFLSLLIFLRSMRKAQVKVAHVLRCAVYSTDIAPPFMLLPAGMLMTSLLLNTSAMTVGLSTFGLIQFPAFAMIAPLLLATFATWKLTDAYHRYLGFPHAVGVAISSQLIVALFIVTVMPVRWLV